MKKFKPIYWKNREISSKTCRFAWHECSACKGTGKQNGKECPVCKGKGEVY